MLSTSRYVRYMSQYFQVFYAGLRNFSQVEILIITVRSCIRGVVDLMIPNSGLSLSRDNPTLDRELNQLRVIVQV
jgi:hypothetical protein